MKNRAEASRRPAQFFSSLLALASAGMGASAADPAGAAAANPAAAPSAPFTDFTAEQINYNEATNTIDAVGHARLRDGAALITADEIHYNRAEDSIDARGHVVFT